MSSLVGSLAGCLEDKFRNANVLVVGDIMLDEYVEGVVSRISPEAPVPVLDVRSRYSSAGGAANVAMNVAGLGATAWLVGLVGNDAAGEALRHILLEAYISDDTLVDAGERGTISKTRIVAGQQQICRIDHEVRSDVGQPLLGQLMEEAKAALEECDIAILSDYAKGVLTEAFCAEFIGHARTVGKPVIVDPKSRDFRKYAGCSVITPNLSEAFIASGVEIHSDDTLAQAGRILLTYLPGSAILVTRGSEGMALFEQGAPTFTIPTVAREVFDVVGAGDTAVATLAVALAAALPLREAMVWANVAAGIVVEKLGTATVTWAELAARK